MENVDWEKWFGANAEQRNQNVQAAAEVLERWIQNLIREGLGRVTHSNQEGIATALTDLQAPALAQRVRQLDFEGDTPEAWEQLLEELALLVLWSRSLRQTPQNADFALHLRQWAGVNLRKNTVLEHGRRQKGTWYVWGAHTENLETGLRAQRIWLQEAHTQNWALILDFTYGQSTLQTPLEPNTCYDLELSFYPAVVPLRAIITTQDGENNFTSPPSLLPDTTSILDAYAVQLGKWPWLEQLPTGWEQAQIHRPVAQDEPWLAGDTSGEALPLRLGQAEGWALFAFACGAAIQLFGEWDGMAFLPLWARKSGGQTWHLS